MSKVRGPALYRLVPSKTLFMLCDVQEKFKPAIPLLSSLIENTTKLHIPFQLAAGKILQVPLLVTEQYPERLGKTVCELDIGHACANVSKTMFSMLVEPVRKSMTDIFGGKPKTAVLFGLETHVCVEQTAFDLVNDGVDVWLVADCCASRLNQDRDLALERLRHIGCNIATSESVIFNLLGDKDNKSFKEIASLVKKISADMQLARASKS
ncbi:isochorismatase domain-containing protein 1 isoform X1 [Drosophila teissieri]|uniref:isochorismatase domain-containing protein 1 isoform X1 n=1 Tax=Drosophila teissieri TaxID=7243 RepID=UPI001CBA0D7C|nr:isochorismatase domain-containing protein 1 isoform X1 [Drosophila teissieri]